MSIKVVFFANIGAGFGYEQIGNVILGRVTGFNKKEYGYYYKISSCFSFYTFTIWGIEINNPKIRYSATLGLGFNVGFRMWGEINTTSSSDEDRNLYSQKPKEKLKRLFLIPRINCCTFIGNFMLSSDVQFDDELGNSYDISLGIIKLVVGVGYDFSSLIKDDEDIE